MVDYEAGLDGVHSADIDFMIKHNFMSKSVGGAINYRSGTDPIGEFDPVYIRRANYWPFLLTKEIFERDYERIHTSTILLGSETRKPFIKCFYYDNPASLVLPSNFCGGGGQGTGGTINPVFYMYYYNPYPDDITFKHEEIIGYYDDPGINFTPTSDQAAFKKYFKVNELYRHGGINQYMKDNTFYNSATNVSPDINGISSQVYHLCEGDSIVLNAYSIGYVYWEITPTPNREGLFTENTTHKVWPVPAEKTAYIQLTLPNEEDLYTLNLFSLTGELVQQKDFSTSGYDEIQRENLSSGMYFYSIINQTGLEIAKGKMIWE
ncbi:MAG: T9SS type A sorting domain-containing protein [Bacteroidetes bacterium]|nr:T9SS type A sorting domain-containing protein [Bacteroidota bacterium]